MKEKFPSIYKEPIETLQINIGYKCNQACKHCHVNSSPLRTEKMSNEIISLIPKIIDKYKIKTLDITGGAPELHPEFKNLIASLSTKQVDIIDRCNLTIFFEEGYEDLPQFLAKNKVIVTASLPCYEKNNVEIQRGLGVFEKSINAIKILNNLGYGKKETGLQLNLVYNPVSPILPPSQEILEKNYKKILFEKYNIVFNNLYTITNMPINRYEESLRREGKLNTYYKLLKENFNENNLENLMCKKTISVNWLGEIYDCDFNQQINFRENKGPKTLFDLLDESFTFDYGVAVKEHCFACTAGAGSSCGGTLS
ncbi:arsenosugar biosynthesis radical SAM (seleno)protein ArsS [Prochlorococcus marinus]|jgi:radical SAM/Cys-rich protein|uniref:Predicted Fe-S oxidoreductases n=1 Tax=Prochlorococcus marinus (strain AS9601) TaxID=146891 RepID=A2BQB9_PROMS|nr:arsenosugar biosynthesis radical SAM (seleno)protein ArsS [Prochlorococcus marinus]ABM69980.1 Predicted Fe-S oxidoreductases [Prochlorococcus marinus str. AS9601]